jgi:DNA-binding NtrC family response regulator
MQRPTLLIVDDEASQRLTMQTLLNAASYRSRMATQGPEALEVLFSSGVEPLSLVLLDLHMPGMHGLEVLKKIRHFDPMMPVIVVTANDDLEVAVEAMRMGANDFIVKPVQPERLLVSVENALRMQQLRHELFRMQRSHQSNIGFSDMIGSAESFRQMVHTAQKLASSIVPLLIGGERGTGKSMLAQAIHTASGCATQPLIQLEGAAWKDGMRIVKDHTKPMTFLLRLRGALPEEGVQVWECAIHASSVLHRWIVVSVDEGVLLRLQDTIGAPFIHVPPLREREQDIVMLAEHFLGRYALLEDKKIRGFMAEAEEKLFAYDWPGNLRQLEQIIRNAVALAEEELIKPEDFAL